MNSIRKNDKILLTYYVNPHHFYFKYKEDALGEEKLAEVNKEIEHYVNRHIENRHWQNYSPQIGEIVLCHYISDCVYKWIRGRVDFKLQYNKEMFILWAIDYGFPIETDGRLIRPIEADELRVVYEGLIFKGGLFEIVPSIMEYNFMKAAEEPRKTKKWSSRAVQMVEKYLHQADDLTFKCRAYYEDHFFGSLIIQSLVVAEFLKSSKEGVNSDNFMKEFSELDDQPYWQRQQDNALYKIYENNSDFYGSEDVTTTWVTSDDLLSKCDNLTDMPKLCESTNKNTTTPDDTLIELCHQFSDSKLSQSCRNSTFSYRTSVASTIATKTTQPNVTDTKATISAVPLKNRLAVAQQKMIEQGFIVDNKAIEEKYKEHRDNDMKRFDSTKKRNKSRFDKAKEMEECFSVNRADRLLVHNHGNIPCMRISNIHEADFPPQIHDGLKALNIQQIFRIQTVGWPGLMGGNSMIFVNNALTGKTWTYLPAICGLIIQRIQDNTVVGGCGPLAIIACASTQEVNETTNRIGQLLRFASRIRCFKAFGFTDQANAVCNLLNGAEILVTTVPCLHRLMVNEMNLFTKERIISLVFDNIDLAYERFSRQIHEIHKALCASTSHVQLIITSRTWHKVLANFYEESSRVTLCIGSYIEAVVYGRTKMTIELLGHKFKIDKLISHINDIDYSFELTIVLCNTSAEVEELVSELKSMSIKIWYYHDESDSFEIGAIKRQILNCKPGLFKLLICTDEVLHDIDIRCAKHIVHFTLPETWTIFGFRFSTLFNHHHNLLERKSGQTITTSVVFLDENNNNELPRLVDFMQVRGNCNIPDHVLRLAESIRIENALNIYQPFCNDLATIGSCYGQFTCRHRHILTKFDGSRSDIPQNGFVKFDIIAVRSPVHYTVRLLEHRLSRDVTWTRLNSTADFLSFNMEMMMFFKDDTNRTMHFPIALGDLCAVCVGVDGENLYERGKIIKIEEKKYLTVTTQHWVEVLLIDSNERMSCYSTSLMTLPDKFKNFPHQAVDIRIANIVPRDFDNEWDSSILELVKKWIGNENKLQNHHYCQGFVKLSIMNTLWVDSVDMIEVLQSIDEEVKTTSIKRNLLNKNFCVRDSKPLELLTILAKNAGLLKEENPDTVGLTAPTEIVDRRATKEELIFNKPDDDNYDLDESNPSLLNWSTSSGDDDDAPSVPVLENQTDSAVSDADEEDLLLSSQDKWAELPVKQFHKVFLGNFYHPNRMYIRNSFYETRFVELTQRIEKFTGLPENLVPLSKVALAVNCLAKVGSQYMRAKLMKLFHQPDGITAEVLFVDFGDFVILPTEELIEIPEKFVTALPFQAIFCILIGIRPIDSPKWCDNICDTIYDDLLMKQSHFYARSMQLGGPDKYAYGLKSRSYQVVLFDETGHFNINNWIVSSNYGEPNPDTKHFVDVEFDRNVLPPLNSESSNEFDCKESDNDELIDDYNDEDHFDIQFDDDEIMNMLQANGIPFTKRTEQLPAEIKEIQENEKTEVSVADKSNGTVNFPVKINTGLIDSQYKIPKIKWHQTESIVALAIHAPDVNDYCLSITSRMLKVCFVQQQEKYATILNLFGCIEPKYTIHCIRGLYITVRLVKTLNKLLWPRLVQQREKDHFIAYNFEADKCQDTQFVSEKTSAAMSQLNESYYSSSDEDREEDAGSDAELL
ncbi:putative ATP-dependent RNA helicase TDRD12 isoform X2 [Bradysia coprophila]|uniref:putative ATP-dependent RNA helicase TDRD12 isoform X2 n=1 Tax=Bradysia coprophila TaxID=38358 RepID=UPI00187DCA41|nr:putative ATP-dependent RNA helicase TDRD12 isoform X2 [Bradysia coprophila]